MCIAITDEKELTSYKYELRYQLPDKTVLTCTLNKWWLVLSWENTKEDYPRLRFAYKFAGWQSKFNTSSINDLNCEEQALK